MIDKVVDYRITGSTNTSKKNPIHVNSGQNDSVRIKKGNGLIDIPLELVDEIIIALSIVQREKKSERGDIQ